MTDSQGMPRDPIDILKAALLDPLVAIDYVGLPNKEQIAAAIRTLPRDALISEWVHKQGGIRYEYHSHTNRIKEPLKQVYDKGIKGGNPWFSCLYPVSELEKITQASPEDRAF